MTILIPDSSNDLRFGFQSAAPGCVDNTFAVVLMSGEESLSQPYRFELTLVSDNAAIDLDAVLGAAACLQIHAPVANGVRVAEPQPYHGMLAEFEQLEQLGDYTFYRAVLVPRLWALSQYRSSEVYLHEQSITDIIDTVLGQKGQEGQQGQEGQHGLAVGRDYELRTTQVLRPRSYVCQYQESPLDFISRWMEREGLYYYFEQVPPQPGERMGHERLVILDARTAQPAQVQAMDYRPADELDTGLSATSIQSFVCRTRRLPRSLVLQDFNHRRAGLPLVVRAQVSPKGMGEEMLYGENFRTPEEGERYAKIRAQEMLCQAQVFSGQATALGLRSGYCIDLSHHYRSDFDGRYLLTRVSHEGSQAGAMLAGLKSPYNQNEGRTYYRSSFEALAEQVQFRAPRITPRPRVSGTMTATIDAEGSGQYAELDEYGQYKVQVPFDRSEKAAAKGSARIRMASPYSGSDHGMHFPLHKGAEVLLSFSDGDPDQPVITAAVPNSLNPSVINQDSAHDNLISTKGGNQLLMKDTEGKEVIWLNSPFHKSSIGVGSILPQGGGSIYEATTGGSDKVSFGTNNSMSFGSSNALAVSTDASIKGSMSNGISWGTSLAVSAASGIKWNMDATLGHEDYFGKVRLPSFTIDDSSSVKVSEKFGGKSHKAASIEAGILESDLASVDFTTSLRWFRFSIFALTAVNFTQSTVFAMAVNGSNSAQMVAGEEGEKDRKMLALKEQKKKRDAYDSAKKKKDEYDKIQAIKAKPESERTDDEKKLLESGGDKPLSEAEAALVKDPPPALSTEESDGLAAWEADAKKSPMNRDGIHGWRGILGKFGVDAFVNGATFIALQYAARSMAAKLEALKYVSKINSGLKGVRMSVNDDEAPQGGGAATNHLVMDADTGVKLSAENNLRSVRVGPAAPGPSEVAKLSLGIQGDATLQGSQSVTIVAPAVSLAGSATSNTGIAVSEAEQKVSIESPNNRVTVSTDGFKAMTSKVELGYSKAIKRDDLPDAQLLKTQIAAKTAELTVEKEAFTVFARMWADPGQWFIHSASEKAEIRKAHEEKSAQLQAELDALQGKFAQLLPPDTPLLHGLTLDDTELKLAFGTGGLQVSNAGLKLSLGGGGQLEFTPASVKLDGPILQLC